MEWRRKRHAQMPCYRKRHVLFNNLLKAREELKREKLVEIRTLKKINHERTCKLC